MVTLEGLGKLENAMISSAIETATFRFCSRAPEPTALV
jgi:hypothetical protein